VQAVTNPAGKDFVPAAARIAVFDNDGTLWAEQPMYFHLAFALDRVRALAPSHPEWKTKQPFKAVLDGDMKASPRPTISSHQTVISNRNSSGLFACKAHKND